MSNLKRKRVPVSDIISYWQNNSDSLPNLYAHYIGWGEPFCFCCHQLFSEEATTAEDIIPAWNRCRSEYHIGHLQDWSVAQNDDVSNLVPICETCNLGMPRFDVRENAMAYIDSPLRRKLRYAKYETIAKFLVETAPVFVKTPEVSHYLEEPLYSETREKTLASNSIEDIQTFIQILFSIERAYEEVDSKN